MHALGPDAPPSRYYAGHERSNLPEEPPNHAACAELRGLSATVGYPHPVFAPFGEDGSTEAFFANPRSVEARELVVDAALGLVDSIDLLSPFDDEAAVYLYHRLLSCGLRLTATAGTDVFLSFANGPGVASNPPGWARVYAHLGDTPLSVEAFKQAIRDGRTVVTNGPWPTFAVAGRGPGAVIDARVGERLTVAATVIGADRLAVVGPDGVVAETGDDRLACTVEVDGPTWLAAVARGPATGLAPNGLAHTTPVYVDVDGARVARAAAADLVPWPHRRPPAAARRARHVRARAARAAPRRLRRPARRGPPLLPGRAGGGGAMSTDPRLDLAVGVLDLHGGPVQFVHPREPIALLDDEDVAADQAYPPYWAEVWRERRRAGPRRVRPLLDRRVGAGARVRARAAVARGRARRRPRAGHRPRRRRARLHGCERRRERRRRRTALCAWSDPTPLLALAPWDLVLAADVLYGQRNVDELTPLLPGLVEDGEVWVADPGRPLAPAFLAAARERWAVVETLPTRQSDVWIHRLAAPRR